MYMESARTYGKGTIVFGLKSMVMKRKTTVLKPDGLRVVREDNTGVLGLPVTFGLTDEVDLTASFFGFNDARVLKSQYDVTRGYSDPEGGMGASRFAAKVRFPFRRDSRIQIAGKFGAIFDTSAKQIDGINYRWSRTGTDIEVSLYETLDIASFLSLSLEQGYVVSGSEIYDDQHVFAAGLMLNVTDGITVNLEVVNRTFNGVGPQAALKAGDNPDRYYPNPFHGESVTGNPAFLNDTKNDYKEDFYIVSPSIVFHLTNNISVDIGANINIADQIDPRETVQGVFGITFTGAFTAMIDLDGDGISNRTDLEPDTPRGYPVDSRGIALDADGDGVPNGRDREPDTPLGAVVNTYGIGNDSDDDGVYDGLDMESDTPRGCPVDGYGVALDDDRDGVPNGLDREPETLLGAIVDARGISLDDDGDGVPNGIDREPETLRGALVDSDGVAIDSDGDDVPDGIDLEPNTPRGILVDTSGRALIRQEYSLLREGLIRLNIINFASGSTEVGGDAHIVLDEIGRLLKRYPSLKIQIGGHTDNIGDREFNYEISRERALAVREYLLSHFPETEKDKLLAVGFGADKPIASNATYEGRRQNRRVEFVVLNQEEILNINRNP